MTGGEVGAYMLGASIAGNNARDLARIEAETAEIRFNRERIAFDRERIALNLEYFKLEVEHAYEAIVSNARMLMRLGVRERIEKLANAQTTVSSDEVARIFEDELDAKARSVVFLKHAREYAAEWAEKAPKRQDSIRQALARVEENFA
jgi:hypothetical protein